MIPCFFHGLTSTAGGRETGNEFKLVFLLCELLFVFGFLLYWILLNWCQLACPNLCQTGFLLGSVNTIVDLINSMFSSRTDCYVGVMIVTLKLPLSDSLSYLETTLLILILFWCIFVCAEIGLRVEIRLMSCLLFKEVVLTVSMLQ